MIAKRSACRTFPARARRRQGQGAQDGGLRRRRRPLEEEADQLATLLLGLYRDDGELDYVGSAAVAASRHDEILKRVEPLLKGAPNRGFSEPSRWGSRELDHRRCKPKLVVEVRYDKLRGHRFRHGTRLLRFRDDKDPDAVHLARGRAAAAGDPRSPTCWSARLGGPGPSFANCAADRDLPPPHPGGQVADLVDPLPHRLQRELRRVARAAPRPSVSGADARASGVGRIEYADAIVRSRAFWP